LPAPRYNAARATLDGTLYVAGGVRNIDPVRTVFAYDARANCWRLADSRVVESRPLG
jgi:N-acetylneuraminic acid mutarotase